MSINRSSISNKEQAERLMDIAEAISAINTAIRLGHNAGLKVTIKVEMTSTAGMVPGEYPQVRGQVVKNKHERRSEL